MALTALGKIVRQLEQGMRLVGFHAYRCLFVGVVNLEGSLWTTSQ